MQHTVITAVGSDRPGIVDQLTEALAGLRANIADSRMSNLAGQFAIVMLLEVPDDAMAALRRALPPSGRSMGLAITVAPAPGDAGRRPGVPYRVRTYAMDQAGLVHRFTHLLHARNVNIEQLDTRLEHGAHTGTPLFSMDMVITVPEDVKLKELRDQLETLSAELNCDLDIDRA